MNAHIIGRHNKRLNATALTESLKIVVWGGALPAALCGLVKAKMTSLDPHERAANHYEEALRSEDYLLRVALLKRAVALNPEFSDAYVELGRSHLRLNDIEEAERALRTAIELDGNGWAHLYLGNLFYGEQDWEAALAEFHEAEKCFPELSVPLWCAGDIHRETGDLEESERYYRRAVAVEPSDAAALARLGRLLIERGNRIEGAAYIKQALTEDGSCKVALKWKRHNAAHHAPAGPVEVDEMIRVAGRVHALVRLRHPQAYAIPNVRLRATHTSREVNRQPL